MEGPKKLSVGQLTNLYIISLFDPEKKFICYGVHENGFAWNIQNYSNQSWDFLKDFKSEAQSTLCKPRLVPFAIMEDLNDNYMRLALEKKCGTLELQCLWNLHATIGARKSIPKP